jgi:RNA polymerase sigma-70 factor (ECF subfamily)
MLDALDLDKRAVFVMFEIEGMGCEEIASVLGIPVGTVYSRLHVARRDFEKALARHRAREARMPGGW